MFPLELVATPTASPRYRCSGSFSRLGVESKGISGMYSCAKSVPLKKSAANGKSLVIRLLLSSAGSLRPRRKFESLHSPAGDLGHRNFVVVPAIHFVDGAQLAGQFAGFPEFADEASITPHLVNLPPE